MSNILKQRRLLTKRDFELTSNFLKISVKTPSNHFEGNFRFEEIGRTVSRRKSYNRYALGILGVFLFGFIITFLSKATGDKTVHVDDVSFYIFFSAIMLGVVIITSKDMTNLSLMDGRHIAFFTNSPDRSVVQGYIEQILAEQKQYLLKKYAKPEPFLSPETIMHQLMWLKDRDVIDDVEFEKFKSELLPSYSASAPIGFTINPTNN